MILLHCRKVARWMRRNVVTFRNRRRYLSVAIVAATIIWIASNYVSPRDEPRGKAIEVFLYVSVGT